MRLTMKEALFLDYLRRIEARQGQVEDRLEVIERLLIEGVSNKAGYSQATAMHILGITDRRTFVKHANLKRIRGSRFLPADIGKIRESLEQSQRRPHLKKINARC